MYSKLKPWELQAQPSEERVKADRKQVEEWLDRKRGKYEY
jgi:hypothetical protein